ncbi:uncharacterized protein PRCAT00003195001 [Priceomyces carsonii]|uniref:uncharacterized protein n=1 Tax=Priceomyces carsonii TaxID=28549 RepID=UPI002ED90CD3|nr:unnamed protein product [Priceomyces carsonii]
MKKINFFKGHPSVELLPSGEISEAYRSVLMDTDYLSAEENPLNRSPLNYGTDPGNIDVRTTISQWNNKLFHRTGSGPDKINLTSGASYGIANILASVTDVPTITKRGFIVSPTYFLINNTFIDFGFEGKLTAIEETPNKEYDIDLEKLEECLKLYSETLEESDGKEINVLSDPLRSKRKLYRFVIYVVPTYSNPGGLTYSVKTRLRLLELARQYDMLIISDDVYDLLNYTGAEDIVPRINYLDEDTLPSYKTYGNSISNATFSKISAPGLRVGWQETPTPKLAQQLANTGANKSGGTPAQLASYVVQNLIQTGTLEAIVKNLKDVYAKRVNVLKASIGEYLPDSTIIVGGDGGYFLWVSIPGEIDHDKVVDKLEKENVILASGKHFEVHGDTKGWGRNCVRLAVSYLSESEIDEGIKKWGQVLRREYPELYLKS